ncbi:T9SS type A sorting domain-containing protein [Saccharicrinis sp. FJH62]|uniref:T9SS type A sorting domain-containing protein n=1 Tax=Saccharicrinis sp. FJH62 TaxID=3344657 RepID=UPI0035D4F767
MKKSLFSTFMVVLALMLGTYVQDVCAEADTIKSLVILPTGKASANTVLWSYTLSEPLENWMNTDYNEADDWFTTWTHDAPGGFGNRGPQGTEWTSAEGTSIWLRKIFNPGDLSAELIQNMYLNIFHDDDVIIYINGVVAFQETGWNDAYEVREMTQEGKDAFLSNQDNLIAVKCTQGVGGQMIDFGIETKEPATAIIPTAQLEAQTWKYKEIAFETIDADWNTVGFDDSGWSEGQGGFGDDTTILWLPINTVWGPTNYTDIYLRKTVTFPTLSSAQLEKVVLNIMYDDDTEVYINGVLAFSAPSWVTNYVQRDITEEARAAIVNGGENTIAVHTYQNEGGQYIDMGILTAYEVGTPIEKVLAEQPVSVYFNNRTNNLTVSGDQVSKVDIYSISGKLVKSVNINSADNVKVNLNALPKGIYISSVMDRGERCAVKFIKE